MADETSSERLIKLRQAAGDIPLPEEVASAEPPPTTPLAPRPNLPAVVDPEQARSGRGIGSFVGALGKRFPLVQAARQGWKLLPPETKADARDIFSSMNEPDPFGLELGLPEEEIVAKIDEFGEGAWGWLERQFGAGEPDQEPTGIATLDRAEGSLRDTAFEKLAYLQRGDPELAMLDVQNAYGGGVYSVLVEHVGDITHRMSEMPGYLEGGLDSVAPKVRRALNVLRSEYTPQREYDESLRNNAQYDKVALEDRAASVDKARENYTEQHRKLPVYNEMQRNARDAAIAIGEQRWADAQSNLEYIEQFLDDPKAYKAEAMKYNPSYQDEGGMAQGGLVNAPLSVNPDVLEYGMYRTPFDMRRAIAAQRFAEGGLASLPRNPVLGGQQHMLAYITPEEASTLRAQGGGVTPDGGQYTGPGGIASFMTGMGDGPGQSGLGSTASGGTGSTGAGAAGVQGIQGSTGLGNVGGDSGDGGDGGGGGGFDASKNPKFTINDVPKHFTPPVKTFTQNMLSLFDTVKDVNQFDAEEAALALAPVLSLIDEHQQLDPKSRRAQQLATAISKAKKGLADSGFVSGAISKNNFSLNPGDPEGFFGQVQGLVDPFGNEFSMADISAMSPAEFSALSSNASTSVIGDPESPFGQAVTGFGTTALGLAAPALSLPLGFMGLAMNAAGVKGMASLAGDAFGYATDSIFGETASDTSVASHAESADSDSTVGQVGDAVSNAYGFVSDAVSDAYGYAGDAVSDAAFSAAQSLGLVDASGNVAQASPFSVTPGNMGAGLPPAQQPSALVPTIFPLDNPIDNIGPLGTVTPEPSTGRFFTIDELKNIGIGQIPSTTSIFAQGGLVDKPLYSRN